MNSASARASSVLPTPVGPRNRNVPIGRSGSLSPARERRSAFETASTASSWPIDPLVQALLHVDELLDLALHQAARPGCRSTCRRPRRSRRRRRCSEQVDGRLAVVLGARLGLGELAARARGSRRGAARRRAGSRARARRARARARASSRRSRSLPWPSACSFSRSHWARMPAACSRSSASSRSISSLALGGGRRPCRRRPARSRAA